MLDELINDNPDTRTGPRYGRATAFLIFLIVSAIIGVLLAIPAIPVVFAADKTVRVAGDVWDNMPHNLMIVPAPQHSVLLDKDGKPFATFYTENRTVVDGDKIAAVMRDAQVSVEDTRFFDRTSTLDLKGFGRALLGRGGGSGITQQYVKNVLMNNATSQEEYKAAIERSPARKLRELRLAVNLERSMSKDDILTGYLNLANYGDGTFGVEAAAKHYFNISAAELTLPQAALLAGIVKNPSRNPVADPDYAKKRRTIVLDAMLDAGRISPEQYQAATQAPLGLQITTADNGCGASEFPYYCAQVLNVLRHTDLLGATGEERAQVLRRGGLTISTGLDRKVMKIAEDAAMGALGRDNQFAAGVAVVEPGTGVVRGVGQNRKFSDTQVLFATSRFQTGSTFKPVTLAAALEDGWDIAARMDAPVSLSRGGKVFRNVSSAGAGSLTAAEALAVSSNTFFVKMSTDVTSVRKVQQVASRLGMPIPGWVTGEEASTTLGVFDASPVEVANMYATFASGGVWCRPTWVTRVVLPGGGVRVFDSGCRRVLSRGVALTVAHATATVVDGPLPGRTGKAMSIGRPVMGKTGTTTGNSAVWFAGGSVQFGVAVWVGDPRGGFEYPVESLRLYGRRLAGVAGSTAAGPVWREVMAGLHEGVPVTGFGSPDTVTGGVPVLPDVSGLSVSSAVSVLRRVGCVVESQVRVDSSQGLSGVVVGVDGGVDGGVCRVGLVLGAGSDTKMQIR